MEDARLPKRATADWLRPQADTQGLVRYIATIRDRWWLVLVATVIAVLVSIAYVATTAKTYQAEADLLISPVTSDNTATQGLGLITQSNDPTQDVSTAARLVTTPSVGLEVNKRLGLTGTPTSAFANATVEPIAQSNLVSVVAKAGTPEGAANLANTIAQSVVSVRTAELHQQISVLIPALQKQVDALPKNDANAAVSLGQQISGLYALKTTQDPTIRVAATATPPTSAASPKPKLAIAAGLIAGLMIGLGAAFASQALDPRLRREEQLRSLYALPILGRVPIVPRTRRRGPLSPKTLPPAVHEAYRTLRATLVGLLDESGSRSLLVTSSGAHEGKTTTAINIAHSLATAGNKVILIEADIRRPTISRALDVNPESGIGAVIVDWTTVEAALHTTERYGPNLSFLLAESAASSLADRLTVSATARRLISEAEKLADYVIVDSPPLTEVVDALPLVAQVDAVLLIARLRVSRLKKLTQLGELLQGSGVVPIGIAEVAADRLTDSPYYLGPRRMSDERVA